MLAKTLEEFGLSDKEAAVYLSLLELGPSVVSSIAKHSRINRSTVYVVLSFLAKRGFVSTSDVQNVRLYTAASPERLVKIAQESADKYKELTATTKSLLPKLRAMQSGAKQKPRVQFFDGDEGIEAARQEILGAKNVAANNQSAEVRILKNKIALIAPAEKFALIIQSDELANTLKENLQTARKTPIR
ncbi:hypothetical protein KGM48_00735 [Patescibacteria group bacterium]|nr:hypothetical protein [Patescibacteria group bacterium]